MYKRLPLLIIGLALLVAGFISVDFNKDQVVEAHTASAGAHPLNISVSDSVNGGTVNINGNVQSGSVGCNNGNGGGIYDFSTMAHCDNPDDYYVGPGMGLTNCPINSSVSYTIKQGGSTIRSGSDSFSTSNSPSGCSTSCVTDPDPGDVCQQTGNFSFSESGLAAGDYTVEVTGTDCSGSETHTHSFTIPQQCSFTAGLTVNGQTGTVNIAAGTTVDIVTSVASQTNCSASPGWRHKYDAEHGGSSWDNSNLTSNLTSRTFQHTYNTPGTYTVAAEVRNGAANINQYPSDVTVVVAAASSDKTLTVTKSGTGVGTVTGTHSGSTVINCGGDCTETVSSGSITLTASHSGNNIFRYWSGGACNGSVSTTCVVSMDGNKTVDARFDADDDEDENGICNPSAAKEYDSGNTALPSPQNDSTMCSTGTYVAGSGAGDGNAPATWTCQGTGSGTNATCNATVGTQPASCGTAARNYEYYFTEYDRTGSYPNFVYTLCSPTSNNPNPVPSFPAQGGSRSWTCGADTCTATRNSAPPTYYETWPSLVARNTVDAAGYATTLDPQVVHDLSELGQAHNQYFRAKVDPATDRSAIHLYAELEPDSPYNYCGAGMKTLEYSGNTPTYQGLSKGFGTPNPTWAEADDLPGYFNKYSGFYFFRASTVAEKTWTDGAPYATLTGESYFEQDLRTWTPSEDKEIALWCMKGDYENGTRITSRIFAQLTGDIRVISQDDSAQPLATTWTVTGSPETKSIGVESADETVDVLIGPGGVNTYTLVLEDKEGYDDPTVTWTAGDGSSGTGSVVTMSRTATPITFTVTYPEEACAFNAILTVNGQTGTVDVGVDQEFDIDIEAINITGPCNMTWWRYDREIDYANFVSWAPNAPKLVTSYNNGGPLELTYTYNALGQMQVAGRIVNNPGGSNGGGGKDVSIPTTVGYTNVVTVDVGAVEGNISASPNPCTITPVDHDSDGQYSQGTACATDVSWDTSNVGAHAIVATDIDSGFETILFTETADDTYGPVTTGTVVVEAPGTELALHALDSGSNLIEPPLDTVTVTGIHPPECSDGFDNLDAEDTIADYNGGAGDPGCTSDNDPDERNAGDPQCSDGVDNDQDGFYDHANSPNRPNGTMPDPGCDSVDDDDEINTDAECSDRFDNDGDGYTDFSGGDPECVDGSDNSESGIPDISPF